MDLTSPSLCRHDRDPLYCPSCRMYGGDQVRRDLQVLGAVGRMYLDALDADPENEMLTALEALRVTEVREAVARAEAL